MEILQKQKELHGLPRMQVFNFWGISLEALESYHNFMLAGIGLEMMIQKGMTAGFVGDESVY